MQAREVILESQTTAVGKWLLPRRWGDELMLDISHVMDLEMIAVRTFVYSLLLNYVVESRYILLRRAPCIHGVMITAS